MAKWKRKKAKPQTLNILILLVLRESIYITLYYVKPFTFQPIIGNPKTTRLIYTNFDVIVHTNNNIPAEATKILPNIAEI